MGNYASQNNNAHRNKNGLGVDPVYGQTRIASERRRARGPMMPTLFLTLELTLILLLIYTVGIFHVGWLTGIGIAAGIYVLFTSCLPRYHAALERQKRKY